MLPKVLSEDLCSLKPKTDRFAFTAEMDFDRHGTRLQTAFYPSIITSNDRMTYTAVKKILVENDPQARTRYQHLLQDLELMGNFAEYSGKKDSTAGAWILIFPNLKYCLTFREDLRQFFVLRGIMPI